MHPVLDPCSVIGVQFQSCDLCLSQTRETKVCRWIITGVDHTVLLKALASYSMCRVHRWVFGVLRMHSLAIQWESCDQGDFAMIY